MEKKQRLPPHRTLSSSRTSSAGDDGNDLAAVFGSLRSVAQTSSPSSSVRRSQGPNDQELSVVKLDPDAYDNRFLERARADLAQQNLLMMHGKILHLAEQVEEMREDRSSALEKAEANEHTIHELRQQVASLKAQVGTHHVSVESNKQLLGERGREAHRVSTRVDQMQKAIEQQNKQQTDRFGYLEALVKKTEHRVNEQAREEDGHIGDPEEQIGILKRKQQQQQLAINKTAGNAISTSVSPARGTAASTDLKALQTTQVQTNSYLKQVGEKLVDHQNSIRISDVVLNGMRARLEGLHAVMSRISGQKEGAGGIRMDQRDTAYVHLQTQITQLEKQMRERTASNGAPHSQSSAMDHSAADDIRTKIDVIHTKITQIQEQLNAIHTRQKHYDEIALASKFRLEELFTQLTKEMLGECRDADEIVFGVDADQAFVLRQRVLERITIDDMVQVEFERLKVLPA